MQRAVAIVHPLKIINTRINSYRRQMMLTAPQSPASPSFPSTREGLFIEDNPNLST
jgi:hypothetical protein